MSFLAPKVGTPPPPPPPPPAPPTAAAPSVIAAGSSALQAMAAAAGGGMAGTLLTGGQGAGQPATAGKQLTGQILVPFALLLGLASTLVC